MRLITSVVNGLVTPFAGVWIEIPCFDVGRVYSVVTPFAGVWIEINRHYQVRKEARSHSLRGSVD